MAREIGGERRAPARADGSRVPSDVLLGKDWIERWLPELAPAELRLYLVLAREAPTRTYHDVAVIRAADGGMSEEDLERNLDALERKGLIEVVRRAGKHHYHFLCRGVDGYHRKNAVRPSIKEAIEFHKSMMEELIQVASADESESLRERI